MTPSMGGGPINVNPVMPIVYRWLLTTSAIVMLIYAAEDGRGPTWGVAEQVSMLVAGVLVMWVAWRPSRRINIFAAYAATVAVMFEVVAVVTSRCGPWVTASALWISFGAYTVLLISFAWIRKPVQR